MRGLGIGLKGLYDPLKATRQFGGGLSSTILSYNPIAYWKLDETSGTAAINYGSLGTAANGTYSGATLAQIAAPGGGLAPYFDGVNDYCEIYSAALNGGFNGQTGSILLYAAYQLDETSDRRGFQIGVDTNNRIIIRNNTLTQTAVIYVAGGTADQVIATTVSQWNLYCLTFSKSADEFKFYINGSQYGTTQTGLGTYSGALTTDYTDIGKGNNLNSYWTGYIANAAIFNTVLTPEQIAAIYAAGGV